MRSKILTSWIVTVVLVALAVSFHSRASSGISLSRLFARTNCACKQTAAISCSFLARTRSRYPSIMTVQELPLIARRCSMMVDISVVDQPSSFFNTTSSRSLPLLCAFSLLLVKMVKMPKLDDTGHANRMEEPVTFTNRSGRRSPGVSCKAAFCQEMWLSTF